MAWPNSRLRTYAATSPVSSNDLNAIQDAIMNGQHGDRVLNLSPTIGITQNIGSYAFVWAGTGNPISFKFTAGGVGMWALPLRQGDRLKSLTFARFGDGVVDITACEIVKTKADGTGSTLVALGGLPLNNIAAAWTDTVLDPADYTLLAGERLDLLVQPNAANLEIGSIRALYDHP